MPYSHAVALAAAALSRASHCDTFRSARTGTSDPNRSLSGWIAAGIFGVSGTKRLRGPIRVNFELGNQIYTPLGNSPQIKPTRLGAGPI